ncbi:MAG: type II secretion system protein GspN [Nitrospirae bacterium]|nr:type II secretion system protein GspN [Nitrospirota bacterium]
MKKILYIVLAVPVFIILVWFFAVPGELLREKMEEAISGAGEGNISASIKGFKKGLFFSIHADSLDLAIDKTPTLKITDVTGYIDLRQLIKLQLAFSIEGKLGGGNITGLLKYPSEGEIKLEKAELNAVPYLAEIGIKGGGHLSGEIRLKDNNARLTFQIPDLAAREASVMIPFLESFHKAQGAFSINGNNVKIDSISLEGEKGYARLKGDITNGEKNLNLELMPSMDKLNSLESMLIGKYIVSPGYYIVPIK